MHWFLGDLESGLLNLEAHTLDENCFRTVQKSTDREPLSFKIGDKVYFKNENQENGTWNGDLDIELFILSVMDITFILKIKLLGKQGHATSRM